MNYNDAQNWPWSSYPAMVGAAPSPVWLQTDWLLGQFSAQRKRAISKYIDFIRAGVGLPSLWDELKNQIYLGNEKFVQRMQKKMVATATLGEIPRAHRRSMAKPLDYYREHYSDPHAAMAAAYLNGGYTMKAIAAHFDVHYSTVSRAVERSERQK